MATKPDPNLKAAQDLVAAMLDPTKAALEAQRQQLAAEAAQRGQAIQGFSSAAAEQVAPIAGQVQQGYQSAAANTAGAAKGFSLGMQMAMKASEDEINAFLAKQGGPQTVGGTSQAAADVLYGSTGFIPASGLEREGAAFGTAASFLPATMLGRGQQLQYESQREALKVDREYADQLEKLELERPGAIQKALLELRDLAVRERAQRVDEEIAVQKLGLERDRLGVSRENAITARMNAATTRYNAQLKKIQNDRSFQTTLKSLGLQERGLGLRAKELEASLRSGGIKPKELRDLKQQAFDTAMDDFAGGYKDDNGVWVSLGRKTPKETLLDLVTQGVPFSIAVKAIQRVARHATNKTDLGKLWRASLGWKVK